jgi:hypothetical protein
LQGIPKFTQIGNFGLKIYHLATLPPSSMQTHNFSHHFIGLHERNDLTDRFIQCGQIGQSFGIWNVKVKTFGEKVHKV